MKKQKGEGEAGFILLVICIVGFAISLFWAFPMWNVWRQGLSGEASLAKATQERRIQVEQAKAELEAAQLRADAIAIVGQATKDFPEYRLQEFIGAFAEALHDGNISQIVYVPTEANIPIMEATRLQPKDE